MELLLMNAGPNYLSAGDIPLPFMFFAITGVHALVLLVWIVVLLRNRYWILPVSLQPDFWL
jgi:hypothetical protein